MAVFTWFLVLLVGAPVAVAAATPWVDCSDCPAMIAVPPGEFWMGSTDEETMREQEPAQFARWEKPRHRVTIAYRFAVGRYEVTRGQYAAFVAATRYPAGPCSAWDFSANAWDTSPQRTWRDPGFPQTDSHPVVCVSWDDARAYADWLAETTGKPYRLLTEAEWEYAARAGTQSIRFWGDDKNAACEHASVYDYDSIEGQGKSPRAERFHQCRDGFVYTAPGGSFQSNPFGLYDMLGNVYEWLQDCFMDSYAGAPDDGSPQLAGPCTQRTLRGGSFTSTPRNVRSAWRERDEPDFRYDGIGFRIGLTLD